MTAPNQIGASATDTCRPVAGSYSARSSGSFPGVPSLNSAASAQVGAASFGRGDA